MTEESVGHMALDLAERLNSLGIRAQAGPSYVVALSLRLDVADDGESWQVMIGRTRPAASADPLEALALGINYIGAVHAQRLVDHQAEVPSLEATVAWWAAARVQLAAAVAAEGDKQ